MWNNYPSHDLQRIKSLPFLDETLKEVENKLDDKRVYKKDYIKAISKSRGWEDVVKN